ncbi:MAG: ABC-2 transporter permease [Clostridia bacterium]
MKGLLLKDLYNLSSYKTSLLIMVVIVGFVGFSQENFINLVPIMLTTMLGMMALSTFSYDEIAKSDKYVLSLPVSKKEMVKEKYLLALLATLIGVIVSVLLCVAVSYIVKKQSPDITILLTSSIGAIFGISLVQCIQIPSVYKWGAERGRIQMFLLVICVMGIIGGIGYFLLKSGIVGNIEEILKVITSYGMILLIFFTIAMYIVSYWIAYHIYQKKEV